MVPKLEQKILIFGYTVTQGMVLVGLAFVDIILFKTLMQLLGFFGAMTICLVLVGAPALVFKFAHAVPESYLENLIYYHFFKPDIYLPGKEDEGAL